MADDSFETDLEKAQLDTEELSGDEDAGASRGAGGDSGDKVELDLEDAPFLEDEDEEEEEAPQESFEGPQEEEKEENRFIVLLKDKRVITGLGSLLFLILILIFWIIPEFTGDDEPEEPPLAEEVTEEIEEQEALVEVAPEEVPEDEFIVSMLPFWVEKTDGEGKIRFLVAKFAASTNNEKLSWEIQSKQTVLRDAIFFYLNNRDLTFLADKKNVEVLKNDLVSVMNQYLSNDQLETVLIEQYLVK